MPDGYIELGFDKLAAFPYDAPDGAPPGKGSSRPLNSQIPPQILAMNHARVALKGFMLPLTSNGALTTEFLIMRDRSACCYGVVPSMNQWVDVHMAKGAKTIMDQIVTVYGTLKVGEVREGGYLVAIYEMDGERLVAPND